jgi:hypothetical protein
MLAVRIAQVARVKLLKHCQDISGPKEFTKIADEISVRWSEKMGY